ncbi:hypothetical protein M427DRAFT_139753 [Gonapodya prolifera JEL478]|uniref:SART-1 protein n=1 Tax=Gonapodya prolifera (strain JEL478) TaxID=1344416 RepID=A0A139A0C1_GONPJ|nr:hypothetical protein M427DRAFT_139753 [Gonapodya prolifera JEL478]|eukprot:KXS10209.1 hypothetical protein M427DRAFT_139753 [Gonapodya prolifera JEL478]
MSGDGGDIALSIDETNKLRISLGLKPLQVDGDVASGGGEPKERDADAEAEENYTEYRSKEKAQLERTAALDRIARSRNKRLLNAKLAGATLASDTLPDEGGAGADVDDPLAWVKRSRVRQHELAERRRKEQEEMDRQAEEQAKKEYVVSGVRVGHRAEDLVEAGEAILVLKDSTIEENEAEGDELVSNIMTEKERLARKADLAKKKPGYNPFETAADAGAGASRGILSQYDEEIDGVEKDSFVIGAGGRVAVEEERERRRDAAERARLGVGLTGRKEDLQYGKTGEIRDYMTKEEDEAAQTEATFKKTKKKSKKDRKARTRDEVDEGTGNDAVGDVDMAPPSGPVDSFAFSNATQDTSGTNFVDDEDLQAALARQRRLAARKRAREQAVAAPEDIARMIKREEEGGDTGESATTWAVDGDAEMGVVKDEDNEEGDEADPLVLSDTTEFVRNLPSVSVFQERQIAAERRRRAAELAVSARPGGAGGDVDMPAKEEEDEAIEEMDVDGRGRGGSADASDEDGDVGDVAARARMRKGGWTEAAEDGEIETKGSVLERIEEGGGREGTPDEDELAGIVEEPLVGSGLGAALTYLNSRGMLEKPTPELEERENLLRKRLQWAEDQKKKDARRKMEDLWRKEARKREEAKKKKGGGGGQQSYWEEEERAREEAMIERQRARELEDKFKDYKPVVNIEYTNEFGIKMDEKEAFKYLSHRFHGKGSGKQKIEKRLLKIQDKLKEEAASSSAPIGAVQKLQEATKRMGQPHIVLQVGNRGVAPVLPPVSGPSDPSKSGAAALSKPKKRKGDDPSGTGKKAKKG